MTSAGEKKTVDLTFAPNSDPESNFVASRKI